MWAWRGKGLAILGADTGRGRCQQVSDSLAERRMATHTRWEPRNKDRARKAVGGAPQELQSSPRPRGGGGGGDPSVLGANYPPN